MLEDGNINFSDNFIKPNYSAQLTEIKGKIGAFGTRSTKPADLELQGQVNGSAPIDIVGSLNPLAPMAFVDIKAKADGIELSNLTPYSTKYTGYPITKGTLTVDVHYHLENQELTADNHLFIAQLTFGDACAEPQRRQSADRAGGLAAEKFQGRDQHHGAGLRLAVQPAVQYRRRSCGRRSPT